MSSRGDLHKIKWMGKRSSKIAYEREEGDNVRKSQRLRIRITGGGDAERERETILERGV